MTDEGKKGQQGQQGQGQGYPSGSRSDVSDALLEVFKELVNRVGQAPQQGRPLSPEAAAVLARAQEFRDNFNMVSVIEDVKKDEPKQRPQKGG